VENAILARVKGRGLLILVVGAGILIVAAIHTMIDWYGGWPPVAKCGDETCTEGREWVSNGVTLLVILGGLYQYVKAQLWKRSEFVAAEMKAFFADPEVRKATIMIDWAVRRINLFNTLDPDQTKWPVVSREQQCQALLPHVIIPDRADGQSDVDSGIISGSQRKFTLAEAAMRDAYDRLLDGLERVSSYLETRLVTKEDLEPYLGYWVNDIASDGEDQIEKQWTYVLFVYVDFYGFSGVQKLSKLFGADISFGAERFQRARDAVSDKDLVTLLDDALRRRHGQAVA
jgi:hypothetical protein